MSWTAVMAAVVCLNIFMAALHLSAGDYERGALLLGVACAWVYVVRQVRRGEW